MSKTITNLSTLKINYLTSQQYQDALDAGEVDPNELYLTPASGRGSSVTYEQILSSGTAIGRIVVDGAQYTIYAPTPPTSTSALTNDSNFVADNSYVHTDNNYTTTEKDKLSGIASGAEVNQNAFTTVKVGTTDLVADAKSDTLTITAGNNITLTPTANSDSFTIAATDTKYTAATTAPGKVASASSVGTSTNYARQDHTHGIDLATGDSNGQVKIAGTNVNVKGLGTAAYTASTAYLASGLKGAANGVAQLDSNGLVPSTQLPSYVDDVLEYNGKSNFPVSGETGKIYVDTSTNLAYRWSGSTYVEISPSLALGTTSSTAYRGDYGNTAYSHATDSSRLTTATSSGLYKIASTAQGHIASLTAVTKADITALGIPASDTNTDTKVTQTNTTGSADYRVLFSENANDTTQDAGARKSSKLKFNPSTGNLQSTQFNGYTLAAASAKAVDTSISAGSSSANLPTAAAVASFVEGKGYITSADVPEGAAASTTTPKAVASTGAVGTQTAFARGDHVHPISFATTSVGSASAGTAIPADDITAWTTNTPTEVVKKTVVTGGTTTAITPVTSKTVVTSASGATASYSAGVLTITNGSFGTGASVTSGTTVNAYTSLTTGDSVEVTPGTAASLSYTAKSIPNISVSSKTVVTGLSS